ncbi:hypothetical protein GYH30_009885 [Glycine max]|uniref:Protein FAR1-RELATED SEQUENCE n=1 Tax=Glycine max TaxID=3847 RepID=K7KKA6_SOYBN|nr:hypothetical protein GYH30_009885 [Glycine max]
MLGACPKTIIIDQDAAITNAVASVFPAVNHHYCMWHIEKKVSEYLNYIYHEHTEFKSQFWKCIHQSIIVEEFEFDWEAMIDKYGLQDNKWLEKIYDIHAKWIPTFVHQNFVLECLPPKKCSYARYKKEREKTFKTVNSKPLMQTYYPMEEKASKVYTRKLFKIFLK